MPQSAAEPYDALLVLSFGGPERPEDVIPFLQNVTRGRAIPPERLAEVAEHYQRFGGRSPINDQCRDLIAAVQRDFAAQGVDVPIYWGNRNWYPYLSETVAKMAADGVRRAAVFVTSAYASYSGCRQYRENLYDAATGVGQVPRFDKLRHYFNHPGFVAAMIDATVTAAATLPDHARDAARLVFVTHSIPQQMADAAGPNGGAYVVQHREAARLVADGIAGRSGAEPRAYAWDLVMCSRSGPPGVPWLEPDINDHLRALSRAEVPGAVVVPIGFVSDHMEVVYDLDTEAAATAAEVGLPYARAATAGTHPAFVAAVRDLFLERAAVERGDSPARAVAGELPPSWDVCEFDCCLRPGQEHRPALCEAGPPG